MSENIAQPANRAFLLGLFFITGATLMLEVLVFPYVEAGPFFWGPGEGAPVIEGLQGQAMVIDGETGTALTQRDGDRSNLDWPRFDVIQMSLIDTWAATGAGAFTLSENGLYTVEGWRIFLDHLEPNGLFSVSRWYSPDALSETNRLISLAAMSLLRRGINTSLLAAIACYALLALPAHCLQTRL